MAIAYGYQVSTDITYIPNRSSLPMKEENLAFDVKILDLL
ncbi:MAG: hypothetical protein ACI9XC_002103 [Gammaproteobacteria bacterium]|jgi:hypothetical protein